MKKIQINDSLIPKSISREVTHVQRVGGYWYINREFPFLHFEEERLYIFTKNGIFLLSKDELDTNKQTS